MNTDTVAHLRRIDERLALEFNLGLGVSQLIYLTGEGDDRLTNATPSRPLNAVHVVLGHARAAAYEARLGGKHLRVALDRLLDHVRDLLLGRTHRGRA